jgi:L-serine/L-threonine ammonia-lyase
VTDATYKFAQRGNVRSVVLPDAEAAMGCWRLADDERIMVELACGINVAPCYDGRLEKMLGRPVRPEDKVVIVLCGGSNVTSQMLCNWRNEYAYIEEETEARRRKSDSALGSETSSVKDVEGVCAKVQVDAAVPSEFSKPAEWRDAKSPIVIEGVEVQCLECS